MKALAREHRGVMAAIVVAAAAVLAVWLRMGVVPAWILVSVIGALLSGYLANESRHDLKALPPQANGRHTVAWSRLLREFLRFTAHLAYILAGVIALGFLPWRELIVPILMYGNVVMVVNSLIDARTRYLLYATRAKEPPLPH